METGNEAKTIPLRDELPADAGSAHQLLVALELLQELWARQQDGHDTGCVKTNYVYIR